MASRVAHHLEDGLPVDVSVVRITPIYYRHEVQPHGKGKLLPNPKGTYEKSMVTNHVSDSSWEPILQENGGEELVSSATPLGPMSWASIVMKI